jgi:hypothetical protein
MTEKTPWEAKDWTLPDPALGEVVLAVNQETDPGAGQEITLVVNGAVLSGRVIPQWRWAELMAGDDEDESNAWRVVSKEIFANSRAKQESRDIPEHEWTDAHREANRSFAVHITLQDAKLTIATGVDIAKGLWRVRVSQVGAWCLGAIVG